MMRVATTLLTPEEMGKVALILSTIAFFAMFLVNPVGMFINRRLHSWYLNGVAWHYLMRYTSYLLLVALVAGGGMLIFHSSGLSKLDLPVIWLVLLVCGSLIFNTINQTVIPSLNLLGDSPKFVWLSLATTVASFLFATLLVKVSYPTAEYWLLGLLAGQTLLAMVGAKVLYVRLSAAGSQRKFPKIQERHFRALFSFAWPVSIAAGLGWVQSQGYRYVLEGQLGLAELGLFVAGYSISVGMMAGFESVLTTYFQPRLYRDANCNHLERQTQAWQRYAVAVVPSLLLTVVLIAMLAPELTKLFLGQEFQSAASYVIWGALAEAARVLVGVYSLTAHVHMKTRWLIFPNAAGSILSVVLCVLLIPRLGAVGAGIGLVCSGFLMVLMMHVLLARQVGGGIPINSVRQAGVFAVMLWATAAGGRYVMGASGWVEVIFMLSLVGAMFLVFQYWMLRNHLDEKRTA